jgi:hypothetical protein
LYYWCSNSLESVYSPNLYRGKAGAMIPGTFVLVYRTLVQPYILEN